MGDHEWAYAALSWPRVGEVLREKPPTALLLPLGATEPHGPHAPLSTDVLISQGMCRRAAARLADDPEVRALVLPPLPYGVTRYSSGFPGPIHINEETLHAILVDVCTGLIGQGFHYIMLVNNHFEPEHVRTIHRSLDTIKDRSGVQVGYLDLTRKERARGLTEEFRTLGSHAGRYETSLVLADAPALVDEAVRRTLPPVPVSLPAAISAGQKDFRQMGLLQAYNGAPAEGTAAEGQEVFDRLTDLLIGLLRDLVRGTGGRDTPGLFTRV